MVLCSGAFDGLHAGHVLYLEAAKQLCRTDELLVCAIAPDAYILNQKQRLPRWPQHDRLRTVTALGVVDAAVSQAAPSVAPLIRDYRPRLFVKGEDWKTRLPEDVMAACDEVGTAIAYVETPGRHVSETLTSDAHALAMFEQVAFAQRPASEPWTPVTDYSLETRRAIEGPHPTLIRDVFAPVAVADIGCGPGHLVRLLRDLGVVAYGFDKQAEDPLLRLDITQPHWQYARDRAYDLVVCREVLEHLTILELRRAVTHLCTLSSRYVYVTTRFAKAPTHVLSVDTRDDLDPTHITMLTPSLLRLLFVLEGFRRRADLEQRMDWQQKGRVLVYERC